MVDKKPTIVEKNSATVDADEEKKKKNQEKEKKWSKMIKFKKYIYRVLKQVHPDIAISSKAVKIINTIITNIMVKIIHQSSKYINLRRGKSKMLTVREIPAAVMEVFPPQMAPQQLTKLKPLTKSTNWPI